METKPTSVEELFYKLKDYGDTRLDLLKLKGINKLSGFLSDADSFCNLDCSSVFGTYLPIGWPGAIDRPLARQCILGFFHHGCYLCYHRACSLLPEEISY